MSKVFHYICRLLRSEGARYVRKIGIFAIGVAIVGYWISYQDRIADRQNKAWENLRAAINWVETADHWGNAGQGGAIELLTEDCDHWWRGTPLNSMLKIFFPYCVALNSVNLKRMELGSVQAAGANLSYSDISCANLAQANLRDARLQGTDFGGSNLAGADLRGAVFSDDRGQEAPNTDANFWLADMSWVFMDEATKIGTSNLKCGCIQKVRDTQGTLTSATDSEHITSPTLLALLRGLPACPADKCEARTLSNWPKSCETGETREKTP